MGRLGILVTLLDVRRRRNDRIHLDDHKIIQSQKPQTYNLAFHVASGDVSLNVYDSYVTSPFFICKDPLSLFNSDLLILRIFSTPSIEMIEMIEMIGGTFHVYCSVCFFLAVIS